MSLHTKFWYLGMDKEEATFVYMMYPDEGEFWHWLVVMEEPEGNPTRDEIIDTYIETLARVVGSEEVARVKIYTVDTGPYYFAFGAVVFEEVAHCLIDLPNVRWVLPDTYLLMRNDYTGQVYFIDGEAVAYDPGYKTDKEEIAGENREKRREMMQSRDFGTFSRRCCFLKTESC